jgi:UDP-N-acetylglucosamine pyrophosphorylase
MESMGLNLSSKFIKKTDPSEKVGLHVEIDDQPHIVEYSEMPLEE